ncbi:hypothetical protein PSACC_00365 [Paramicrosporidium saccamoebae]|uniref:Uncharacterized protein n=1 Tax=Paramicrosporidium saccamoebae TaxID=1246581 RepID=A0A2H9TPY5_9FUNG|nr:hypothetical protein PSACC_00365 [Paramicrosporidium saccamoebae]
MWALNYCRPLARFPGYQIVLREYTRKLRFVETAVPEMSILPWISQQFISVEIELALVEATWSSARSESCEFILNIFLGLESVTHADLLDQLRSARLNFNFLQSWEVLAKFAEQYLASFAVDFVLSYLTSCIGCMERGFTEKNLSGDELSRRINMMTRFIAYLLGHDDPTVSSVYKRVLYTKMGGMIQGFAANMARYTEAASLLLRAFLQV